VGPDHRNTLDVAAERQQVLIVLEQRHGLGREAS
jgi:hypothetical protein